MCPASQTLLSWKLGPKKGPFEGLSPLGIVELNVERVGVVVGDRQDFCDDLGRVRKLRSGLVGVGGVVQTRVRVLGLVLLPLEQEDLLGGGVGPRQDAFLVGATEGAERQIKSQKFASKRFFFKIK